MSNLRIDIGPPAVGQKVMLATTVYDSPDESYTFSIAASRQALAEAGIQSAYLLLSGNCHVDDARNSVVHSFMDTDCTDLVFLDADVSWRPRDLVRLCQHTLDMVGGVYPYRREDGKAKRGMPYIPIDGAKVEQSGLLEVAGLPTGFLRISRKVFEILIPLNPNFNNKLQYVQGKKPLEAGVIPEIPLLFERTLTDGTRLGGDLGFCVKWMSVGGKIYADTEALLGHVAKTVLKDSLGAFLRRCNDMTLPWMVDRIERSTEELEDYQEVFDYVNNPWAANNEMLLVAVSAARKAKGPIIELGSGLTTILMAATNADRMVYCIEHNSHFANLTRIMAQGCGLTNIAIVHAGIKDRWYDIDANDMAILPGRFGLGLNDGPPRHLGDRALFLDVFGDRCDMIVCDDAEDPDYAGTLTVWAGSRARTIAFPEMRSAIIFKEAA